MKGDIYLYILVMAGVTYLIRVLPLTLIRRPIKNRCDPVRHDLSRYPLRHLQHLFRRRRSGGGAGAGILRGKPF